MKKEKLFTKDVEKKLKFISDYNQASNAASGSKYDANANVAVKNLATQECELSKEDMITLNYRVMYNYIEQLYGTESADQFIQDENNHIIYVHDSSSLKPYCVATSLYPFLLDGLSGLGGSAAAPQHANSYIGSLINLVFLLSSQFAGAVAIPEFLTYFDHFLRVDYGQSYIDHLDEAIELFGNRKITLRKKIEDWFQQFVYSINQPAGARNYQSPFINISYFDQYYFESIFKDFIFPDGDEPCWKTTKELQKLFMKWFNKEREKTMITFPVESFNLLVDKETKQYKDSEMADFAAEMWSEGHSFFCYQSDSADSLSSCCFEGDEIISVRNIDTQEIITLPIKKFCIEHEKDFANYETVSYNAETDSLEFSKLTGVLIKKNEYPNLIKIEAEDGTVLKVTPEHVFLVEDVVTKQKVEIKAKDLVANFDKYELIKNN